MATLRKTDHDKQDVVTDRPVESENMPSDGVGASAQGDDTNCDSTKTWSCPRQPLLMAGTSARLFVCHCSSWPYSTSQFQWLGAVSKICLLMSKARRGYLIVNLTKGLNGFAR